MVAMVEQEQAVEGGCIVTITFQAADTGYSILKVERDDFSEFTAVGVMPDASKGLQVDLRGEWRVHPRYGKQFAFSGYSVPQPTTEDGSISFLSTLRGVGPSLAKTMWRTFGADVFRILDDDGNRLIEVKGIAEKKLPKILDSYQKSKGLRELISFLAEVGVSATYANRIYKVYGSNSITEIKRNPYILAEEVRGFGFTKADEVARALGIAPDSKHRTIAGLMHVLKLAASRQGHCFLPIDECCTKACEELVLPDYRPQMSDIEAVINDLQSSRTSRKQRLVVEGDRVFLESFHRAEEHFAIALRKLSGEFQSRLSLGLDIDSWINEYQQVEGIQLSKGQRDAVVAANRFGVVVVTGGPGVGKMQPYEEPVLTPDGWRKMGDISPGDFVVTANGDASQVLNVYPGKNLDIYRVNFDDGTWTECCVDHLWEVQTPKDRDKGCSRVLTLKEMLPNIQKKVRSDKNLTYYSIPLCDPVQLNQKELPIHPYLLGYLLGDGYLPARKNSCISIWINDAEEVASRLVPLLPEGIGSSLHKASPTASSVRRLVFSVGLNQYIEELGLLGKKSACKFIPKDYLESSITDRKFLLSGLLDTDGYIERHSSTKVKIRFDTTSKALADGVADLVRSLGGVAHVNNYRTRPSDYHVSVRLPFNPFLLSRKADRFGDYSPTFKQRKRIVSAEYVGKKDGQCILIDHPSHLYITRDYTVTHNTSASRAIVSSWHKQGKRIIGCTPTGKASQRLRESTGLNKVSTIHRLLGWTGHGFEHSLENPIDADAFLIDEFSMVDIKLAAALFDAIPQHAVVVIVGDIDQLPSVGAGCVLSNVIESGQIPVVRLTEVFRQAATSKIIQASSAINKGEFPVLEQINRTTEKPYSDMLWLKCSKERIIEAIQWLIAERLPDWGWTQDDIQMLSPMHKGDYGNIAINRMAQDVWNPKARGKATVGDFRAGDRVIQTRNDYDKSVFNGDIGKILSIDSTDKECKLWFPDINNTEGKIVSYDFSDMEDVMLSYSISIHRSQGSEFPVVIMPCTMSHYMMLQRNLYYTGITRGKKLVILVGEERAIATAVKNYKVNQRNTALVERLIA